MGIWGQEGHGVSRCGDMEGMSAKGCGDTEKWVMGMWEYGGYGDKGT